MFQGGYKVSTDDKMYYLNVCGKVCENSGVCTADSEDYGKAKDYKLEWTYNMLKMEFLDGEVCDEGHNKRKSSVIYFTCDEEAGYGYPKYSLVSDYLICRTIFYWKNNVTCSSISSENDNFTTTTLRTTSAAATTPTVSPTSTTPSTTTTLPTPPAQSQGTTSLVLTVLGVAFIVLVAYIALYSYNKKGAVYRWVGIIMPRNSYDRHASPNLISERYENHQQRESTKEELVSIDLINPTDNKQDNTEVNSLITI